MALVFTNETDTLGANPVQWAVDKVLELARKVRSDAERERVRISQNNARLMELDAKARSIRDPSQRARVLASIQGAVRRQGEIATRWRTYAARFAEFAKRFRSFMADHGFTGSTGLGAFPLVPVAIITGLLIAGPLVQSIASMNSAQGRAVGEIAKVTDALLKGQITDAQYAAAVRAIDSAAEKAGAGPDPLGLTNLAEALIPLALIVGAFVILPPLLRARRAA